MKNIAKYLPATTKGKIISYLNTHGEATVLNLAEHLKITPMAVRKHLHTLVIQNLVVTKTVTRKIGRPLVVYLINLPNGNKITEGTFASELLDEAVESYGKDVVVDLAKKRNLKFYERYKDRLLSMPAYERVYETAKIFRENGFDTVVEEEKGSNKLFLKHMSCPILNLVCKCDGLCATESKILEFFVDAEVRKVSSLSTGDSYCKFEIS